MKPTVLLIASVAAWLLTFASAPDGAADLAVRPLSGQTAIGAPRAMARPRQPEVAQGPNLRVAVTTVQVDAVVTDRDGRPVTDLRAEDFEILQDGRRQTISTFGYVSAAGDGTPAATVAGRPATPATTPTTPAKEATRTPPRASAHLPWAGPGRGHRRPVAVGGEHAPDEGGAAQGDRYAARAGRSRGPGPDVGRIGTAAAVHRRQHGAASVRQAPALQLAPVRAR